MDRRLFLSSTLAASAAVAATGSEALAAQGKSTKIIGISCSPRKGKTTSTSIKVVLESAQTVSDSISTELIELADIDFKGWTGAPAKTEDDFDRQVIAKLKDPAIGGIIIGSPVYFRNPSSLCMAFLERLLALRKPKFYLAGKAVGTLCVGGSRNGGQNIVVQQLQAAMLCHEMLVVGSKAQQGALLWNAYGDDIMKDQTGIDSAKNLGIKVAQAVLKLSK